MIRLICSSWSQSDGEHLFYTHTLAHISLYMGMIVLKRNCAWNQWSCACIWYFASAHSTIQLLRKRDREKRLESCKSNSLSPQCETPRLMTTLINFIVSFLFVFVVVAVIPFLLPPTTQITIFRIWFENWIKEYDCC